MVGQNITQINYYQKNNYMNIIEWSAWTFSDKYNAEVFTKNNNKLHEYNI